MSTGEPSQDTDSAKSGDDAVVTPGEPAKHVDVQDGVSVGHHAEPESVEGSKGNTETPPASGAPPTAEDVPPNKPPPKTTREEIYAKAQTGRQAEMEEDMSNMTEVGRAEHVQRLIAEAGGGDDPFAEETTTAKPPEIPAQPPVAPTATPPVAAEPPVVPDQPPQNVEPGIDTNNETTTITVYGRREDVPTADINAAGGLDAYQKNRAADIRMEQAATYEASLRNWDDQLSKRAATLERGTQTPAQDGTGITESSPTDAQGNTADVEAAAESLTDAIYSGDREQAKGKVASVLASIMTEATRAAEASVKQSVASGPTAAEVAAEEQARKEANAVFLNEFQDLDTPVLKNAALSMVKQVAADPVMSGRPLAEITREACTRVRNDVFRGQTPPTTETSVTPNPVVAATPAQPATDLAARHELKRRTVVTPITEAHGRVAEPPANEQTFPSNSEFVQQLKKGRGQPHT